MDVRVDEPGYDGPPGQVDDSGRGSCDPFDLATVSDEGHASADDGDGSSCGLFGVHRHDGPIDEREPGLHPVVRCLHGTLHHRRPDERCGLLVDDRRGLRCVEAG